MHTLFAQEHNLIAKKLRECYPDWDDERVFQKARLINAALMAKIHTIEWTPALLPRKSVTRGLLINWWGLRGKSIRRKQGRRGVASEFWTGIPGSETRHHAADYSITEEFVAVYRMHALLPDSIKFSSFKDEQVICSKALDEVAGQHVARLYENGISHIDAMYSFGIEEAGKMTLNNYPNPLRKMQRQGRNIEIDLATVDIVRDRERGVPRYNAFREVLGKPKLGEQDWHLISSKLEVQEALKCVYKTVDDVDLMIGLYAEDLIDGFAFSETAFRIFIMMANRRLKSDRFFTVDYTPEVYTPWGIDWIENRTMSHIIGDHYEPLRPWVGKLANAFKPWNDPENRI